MILDGKMILYGENNSVWKNNSLDGKIDTLDGFSKLFSRNIKYDLNNDREIIEFADLYPQKQITTKEIDKRISKEIEIDRDCWVVEIEDKNGFNAFDYLDC